uniref:mRNA export factor n=1 Tax=Norrisiella sphaerica TaxID=552664 RepID=A0A7S2QTB8_9EUKA|mmetsp:Transcript_2342/g.3364  ORF Transcript_2342/g.3364 Transcript_2342/m.3364 type:complete len:333 (+) Transcript_2342:93-1091(+)
MYGIPDKKVNTPNDMDGVSSLSFSPKQNHLVASTWCNRVLAWEINNSGQSRFISSIKHKAPVLCTAFSGDGSRVFSGGADNIAQMWVPQRNEVKTVAKHEKPISCITYCDKLNLLCTGSWDKTLKYWDCRQSKPAGEVKLPDKAYCLDQIDELLVVACAGRKINMYNLNKPGVAYKETESTLKNQIRSVAAFPNKSGYAAGSICGRVSITNIDQRDQKGNFTFKCHRKKDPHSNRSEVYAVNAIKFHPKGTFATAGADGQYVFWDKDSRQRLKKFDLQNTIPISACTFNAPGDIFAYAVSYDWSKGHAFKNNNNSIFLHAVKADEISPQRRR